MNKYQRKIHYYETDKMGITHHSNYIRFMEEARMNFLSQIGFPMTVLEHRGIRSPVVSLSCEYKHTTTFDDFIDIDIKVKGYTGVRLMLEYTLTCKEVEVMKAVSTHCFINAQNQPVVLKKYFPALDTFLFMLTKKQDEIKI